MTDITGITEEARLVLLAKLKKFIMITVFAMCATCVVGAVGGWLVYEQAEPGSRIMRIELLLPTIVATVCMSIVLVVVKKRIFGSREVFQEALAAFKESSETDS